MAFDQHAIAIAHGVLACLAWVIFFPLGAVLLRVLSGPATPWKIHTAIQVFAMAMFTAAVGLGLQMAIRFRKLDNYHVVIGLLIFSLMYLQAVSGIVHHLVFKSRQRRTLVSHIHLWLGRVLITLAMINGGLGLKISVRPHATTGQIAAYSVVTALVWLVWVGISVMYAVWSPGSGRDGGQIGQTGQTGPSRSGEKYRSSVEERAMARDRRLSLRREMSAASRKEMQLSDPHESESPVSGRRSF